MGVTAPPQCRHMAKFHSAKVRCGYSFSISRPMRCTVSEKGAVSVYGLQRMPVTLYVEQWERLLNFADQVRQFMKEHDAELKRKGT